MTNTVHALRLTLLSVLLAACSAPPAAGVMRRATLSELVNEVVARASETEALAPAAEGQAIGPGGLARTGADGKVRLDLTEGTIIRLAPQSEFILAELNADVAQPFTRLSLTAGQVWVILSGGELNVETPVGTATVRGSYLSVNFDPGQNVMEALCLEGDCEVSNASGATPLTDGQAAEVTGANAPPSPARPMTEVEFQAWRLEIPEAQAILATPTPEGTPPLRPTPPPLGSEIAPELTPPQLPTLERLTPELSRPSDVTVAPGEPVNTQPLRYSLTNNCILTAPDGTTKRIGWHWKFDGPVTTQVDIPAGESRSGELPPGRYTVMDWDDEGAAHGPATIDSDAGGVNVTHCGQA